MASRYATMSLPASAAPAQRTLTACPSQMCDAISVPSLGWTGLGTGLGLVWLDLLTPATPHRTNLQRQQKAIWRHQ